MLKREYRVDITQRALDLGDNRSETQNALSLALVARYGEGTIAHVYDSYLIIEFPNQVLMFAMGSDCKRFVKLMRSGETPEPEEVHIWRAFRDESPITKPNETPAATAETAAA